MICLQQTLLEIAVYYDDAENRIGKSAASPHATGAGKRIALILLLLGRIVNVK